MPRYRHSHPPLRATSLTSSLIRTEALRPFERRAKGWSPKTVVRDSGSAPKGSSGNCSRRYPGCTVVREVFQSVTTSDVEKLIERITVRHARRTSKRISLDLAREQGNDLIALKTACAHGEFRTLIESRLPFGYAVASDLMKIARQLGNVGRRNDRGSLYDRQLLILI